MTTFERAWCWLWILVKMVGEVLVLLSGSAYVLFADSNENLVLNSVALLFITQIDDVAYSFAVTDLLKGLLNGLPDIGKVDRCQEHAPSTSMFLSQGFGPWLSLFFLFGTISALWGIHC